MCRKKSNSNQILLSVVALLVILLLSVSMTFSWIEGGNTYTIETQKDGDVKTEDADTLASALKYDGTIELKSGTTLDAVALTDYDEPTASNKESGYNGLYFSPVSSADGGNFFFPINMQGEDAAYREANTNDVGTKFIEFEFDVLATENCYVAFNSTPTITAKKGGVTVSDLSAFRFMLSNSDGTKRYVFAPGKTAQTNQAITSVSGATKSVTTLLSSNYLNGNEAKVDSTHRLFEYDEDDTDTLKLSIWLESTASSASLKELVGSTVDINISLAVAQPSYAIVFDAVTQKNTGVTINSDFTGGNIAIGGTTHTVGFTHYVVVGESFTAAASPNDNYTFEGWYSDAACQNLVQEAGNLVKTPTANAKYFAKFVEKPKYTISVVAKTEPNGTGGSVTVNGASSYTDYKDKTATLKAVVSSGYTFDGWYIDEDCTTKIGNNYKTATQTVTISADKTYYAKFLKNHTVTFEARVGSSTRTGGNVQLGTDTAGAYVTKSVAHGNTVKLTATPADGYKLVGIYKVGSTAKIDSGATVTINDDTDYYAEFEKLPASVTTIYFETRSGYSKYYAWVWNPSTNANYNGNTWPGNQMTTMEEGYYKCQFTTTDTGNFQVIVNNGAGTQYPPSGSAGLQGDIGKSYLFTANNNLIEFTPADLITVKASVGEGGSTATVNNAASTKVRQGKSVNLSATASSGYTFEGWYNGSTLVSSNASDTYTVNAEKGSTITLTAKFKVEDTTIRLYLKPNDKWVIDGPRYAVYVWNDSGDNWYDMTADGEYYYVDIDKSYINIIFCRMNPSTTANNWSNRWNQTGDLKIPTDGKNLFTIPNGAWDGSTTTWSVK